jgi:tetratricopeptide (TPR) repeat protein
MDARSALQNLRKSKVGRWPKRGDAGNRFEPYARPWFKPTFSFSEGATIFTIGSCFARNVEKALQGRGFRIPAREFWIDASSGHATDNRMLDNYGVASIYNEIRWALGEGEPYDPHMHLLEVYPGKFSDLHISHLVPLVPFEEAAARRQRIFAMTRTILDSDAVVMTLGLAEVWYDKLTSIYLNSRPYEAVLRANPNRFELHILDYHDVYDYLERTFEMIFRRCKPSCNVLLTVSPVPMSATFSGNDIAVANMYSKSVLRTAAEAISRKYDRINYFPSYEGVMLSERHLAWEDDLIHVRPDVIELNVNAMVAGYVHQDIDELIGSIPEVTDPEEEQKARQAAREQFALAKSLFADRKYSEAIEAARLVEDSGPIGAQALRIEGAAQLQLGHAKEAEAILRSSLKLRWNDPATHGYLARTLRTQGRIPEAIDSIRMAISFAPHVLAWIRLLISLLIAAGRSEEASRELEAALKVHPTDHVLLKNKEQLATIALDHQQANT